MKKILALLILLALPAMAREWYRPLYSGKEFVNPDLTPQRALATYRSSWQGQLVLWEGVVQKHAPGRLEITTAAGPVVARLARETRNLELDRTGYRVAVKGKVRYHNGNFQRLDGQSVILIGPPTSFGRPATDPQAFFEWWLKMHNPHDPPERLKLIASSLVTEARRNNLDPYFFASLVQIESAFDADAVSVSGAIGLGQLMPGTAEGLGVDPNDIPQNLAGSARMLKNLIADNSNRRNPRALALAGYNAGPNLIAEIGTVPAYPQTTNYVYFIGFVHQRMVRTATNGK